MTKTITLKVEVKVIAAVLVALVISLLFISTAYAASFTKNLTEGNEGEDVVALQTLLESKGFLVMPQGVAKGFFGPRTTKALAGYQASVGITPASGYFGPITRGKLGTPANSVGIENNASTPVITKITYTAPKSVVIEGKGFSTATMSGKANTVIIGNALGTKLITLNQVLSTDGTKIQFDVPIDWLLNETPVASIKNETTKKVSAPYPTITYPASGGGGSGGSSSGGGGASPSSSPGPSGSPQAYGYQSNFANVWEAIRAILAE